MRANVCLDIISINNTQHSGMIRSWKMAKEKDEEMERESKGSNIVQIRLSDKQKNEVQTKADAVGLPITQYLIYLITKDLKSDE